MKKKILALTLALVLALTMLAGCGGTGGQESQAPESSAPASQAPESSAPESQAPTADVTLKVAAIETAYGAEMWKEVCDAFTAETGIKVELTCDQNLEDVINPGIQAGEYPDVVHLATGREKALTEQFIKSNDLHELTNVLGMTIPGESGKVSDKIAAGFTDTSATNPYGDGKTYLAPMFYSPCGLFYNAGLFESKGWTVPTTWDEMWELGDKAKAEGISLFTYPTAGYFDTFFPGMFYVVGGPEFFEKATHYEEGVWDTAEGQAFFDILTKLATYTNPKTPAQANNQDFTKNQQMVMDNEALFMPNGTWIVTEMGNYPGADGFKWGMTALPAAKAGGDQYAYNWMEQAWIPAQAEHIAEAEQFVAFLYSDKACDIFAASGAIQPVLGIADRLEGDNVIFYSIFDNGAKAATGGFAAYASAPGLGTVQESFMDPFNNVVAGTLSAEQWISDFKAASDLMRANLLS